MTNLIGRHFEVHFASTVDVTEELTELAIDFLYQIFQWRQPLCFDLHQ